MPPGGAALPGDAYLSLAAFGFWMPQRRKGREPIHAGAVPSGNVKPSRSVATGQRATYLQTGPGRRGSENHPASSSRTRRQETQTPRGITVEGEVKGFTPVTEAGLRNPDPTDWLTIRRDYKAHLVQSVGIRSTRRTSTICAWCGAGPCRMASCSGQPAGADRGITASSMREQQRDGVAGARRKDW